MPMPHPLQGSALQSMSGLCPIEATMELIGSRSAMLIMREAFYGTRRFDDFVRRVDIAPATASVKLRALAEAGLLERQRYREPGGRSRDEYVMTPAGNALMPVIFSLLEWGAQYAGVTPLIEFEHAGCGEPVQVRVECAAGHPVGPDDVGWRKIAAPPVLRTATQGFAGTAGL